MNHQATCLTARRSPHIPFFPWQLNQKRFPVPANLQTTNLTFNFISKNKTSSFGLLSEQLRWKPQVPILECHEKYPCAVILATYKNKPPMILSTSRHVIKHRCNNRMKSDDSSLSSTIHSCIYLLKGSTTRNRVCTNKSEACIFQRSAVAGNLPAVATNFGKRTQASARWVRQTPEAAPSRARHRGDF